MGYALVPLVRPAPFTNGRPRGRRPFGYDQSAHNFVVLDPGDKTQPESGLCLAWFEDDIADRRVEKLADGKDEPMAVSARAKLGAKLGRAFRGDPFNEQIATALDLPPQVDGRVVIWLGPGGRGRNEFHARQTPKVKHSKAWADTFTRANGALHGDTLSGGGATWVVGTDLAEVFNVVSNQAVFSLAGSGFDADGSNATLDTENDTDSAYAQVDWVQVAQASSETDVFLFVNIPTDGSSGYAFRAKNVSGDHLRDLFAIFTEISLDYDTTAATTATGKITRNGSSVEAFIGGVSVLGPVTDTNESSGSGFRYVGVRGSAEFFGGSGTNTVTLDNFLGGDIVTASVRRSRLLHLTQAVRRAAYY